MTTINRIRAAWTGFPGGPGVSTFYSLGGTESVPAIHDLFDGLVGSLPIDVSVQVESVGDQIEDTTGALVGSWSLDAVLPVHGTFEDAYAAPVGVCFSWDTSTIVDHHRLRGRTFIVPAAPSVFDPDGTVNSAALAVLIGLGEALVTDMSGDLVVWHRPRLAKAATAYHPAVTARAGGHGVVTACSVPDKAVVLRSRRD